MTEDDDFEQWSDDARESYLDASAALQAALAAQISTVSAARDDGDLAAVLAANDALDVAASAYSEAQFVLTGSFPAFEVDDLDDEEDEEEDEEDESDDNTAADESEAPSNSVMILTRVVYGLRRERDVIEAGRQASARTHEGDDGIVDLAHALHEIAHDGGWTALDSVDGLELLKRSAWIATAPTPPQQSLDDPFATPFVLEDGAELRYRVDDVL
ncbi:hypothetical protein [Tenggerimyces flavus]|uniref:Uncharacterized protein n=1 Tax=Tenggerimyces flavus TaxID=1708749 RepID=A0ABV7YMB3_9ACTN|nr:hypothetical protein [Tenggerimyces flavus]MBM7787288.1 hypothetical protein [Tenggerimyces flavus]